MKILSLTYHLILTATLTLISSSLCAQIPSYDQWFKGEVNLKNSATFQGDLKYDFRDDILYFKKDTLNLIFHASNIANFKIYRASGACDKYTALAYKNKRKKRYMIFQVVYPGKDSEVLARENYLLTSNYTNIPVTGRGTHEISEDYEYYRDRSRITTQYIYYIHSKGGTINQLKLTRRKVLSAFPDRREMLKDYMDSNNIYLKKFGDLIKVVEFYDELVAGEVDFKN
ncbi:hypothetical protein BH23BAC1_BH23BAC1_30390 [soil metagenome]